MACPDWVLNIITLIILLIHLSLRQRYILHQTAGINLFGLFGFLFQSHKWFSICIWWLRYNWYGNLFRCLHRLLLLCINPNRIFLFLFLVLIADVKTGTTYTLIMSWKLMVRVLLVGDLFELSLFGSSLLDDLFRRVIIRHLYTII